MTSRLDSADASDRPAAASPSGEAAPVTPSRPATDDRRREVIIRHSLATRLTHWVNAAAMSVLLMSGLQILNAHPALYWGDAGFDFDSAWIAIGNDGGDPPRGLLRLGARIFDTTGVLGVFGDEDNVDVKAFPSWLTIPSYRDLATGRRWHVFFAWAFLVNGIIYLVFAAVSGHLKRDLFPDRVELAPRALIADARNHFQLRDPGGEAGRHYNSLQKVSYLAVILGLAPLIVLTGLAMAPGIDAPAPLLVEWLGGRQSARSLHFIAATLLVFFFVVHIGALLAAGVWNHLRSMVTGRFVVASKG